MQVFSSPTMQVGITIRNDEKIEGNEVLTLQLTLSRETQTDVNDAGNIFIRDTSTITAVDRTGNLCVTLK